ncbi:hypothetical protein LCGC14_2706980 [marine sediment metagenome]|uniref:Insertion element IS150 protein InsJ-like helix-turn-helix domain-containing protein n=1 Tax=marine sediment metagenome TaxID=412755 RepID=A0A0F9A1R4_9ZZZZ
MPRKEPTGKHLKALWLVVVDDVPQAEAAEQVGISQSTISRWMRKYKMHRGSGKLYPKEMRFYPGIEEKAT